MQWREKAFRLVARLGRVHYRKRASSPLRTINGAKEPRLGVGEALKRTSAFKKLQPAEPDEPKRDV